MIVINKWPTIAYNDVVYDSENVKQQIDNLSLIFECTNAQKVVLLLYNKMLILCSMMAALKSKVCFIPIDCNLPIKRIENILQEHSDALILTEERCKEKIKSSQHYLISLDSKQKSSFDTKLSNKELLNEIAYIIYTSGSTGNPKGVMIDYHSLENLIKVFTRVFYKNVDSFISFLNPSFDYFLVETLVPALLGKNIYLTTHEESINPRKAINAIKKSDVEVLHLVPSRLLQFLPFDETLDFLKNIKVICLGGEAFSLGLLHKLQNCTKARIYNLYGPTEGTVFTTIADLTNSQVVHIGSPLDGVMTSLIDQDGKMSNEGELVITGINVACGYYNNADATKRSFAIDENGKRSYFTGDYCRYLSDGSLEFLGRMDRQIKSLGHRIELDEIEKCLECVPGVENGAVFTLEGNRKIVGLYIGSDVTAKNVKFHLEEHLPQYMIPNEIYKVNSIPINMNGKKDYKMMRTIYEKKDISEEEFNWMMDLCRKKISDQIENIDEKWSETHRIDSLSYIEIIVETEKKFNFQFPDKVLSEQKIDSIHQLMDLIVKFRS